MLWYDGLYDVVAYWQERGSEGLLVLKYRLVRREGQPPTLSKQVGAAGAEGLGVCARAGVGRVRAARLAAAAVRSSTRARLLLRPLAPGLGWWRTRQQLARADWRGCCRPAPPLLSRCTLAPTPPPGPS